MKKLLISVLVVVLVLAGCMTIFAACDDASDYEHTIIFYSSQGKTLTPITQNAIDSFEAKYPGWTVQHLTQGGYDDVLSKVKADLQAGLQPDLAYCYADHVAQYLESEKVVDLSKYLTSTETVTYTDVNGEEHTTGAIGFTTQEVEDFFIEGYIKEGYADNYSGVPSFYAENALFTLPFVKSTELLYYNEDALKALGVQPAKTWDELWAHCRAAKAKWSSCVPLGYDSEANWFITTAMQRGFGYTSVDDDNHFLFDNDGAKAWLTEIKGYYQEKLFTTQTLYQTYTSDLFKKGPENGGAIYCIGSSGGASNQEAKDDKGALKFVTGVTGIPGVKADSQNQCISQGPSLVMLSGGHGVSNAEEKEKMTFLFIRELLDKNFQAAFAKGSGYNPMRTDVYDIPSYKTFLEEDSVIARAALAAKGLNDRFFSSPAFDRSSLARTQVGSVVQYVILNQKPVDKALKDALKNCGA